MRLRGNVVAKVQSRREIIETENKKAASRAAF